MKLLTTLMLLGTLVALSAATFNCTQLVKYDDNYETVEDLNVLSTVIIAPTTAQVNIGGVGTFHYKFGLKEANGNVVYTGTDNDGFVAYNKLKPNTILLDTFVGIERCTLTKK